MLFKFMIGDVELFDGMVCWYNYFCIVQYYQYFIEKLFLDQLVLQYMMSEYLGIEEEKMRVVIGWFGLIGKVQIMFMGNFFDGQKSWVIFVWLVWRLFYLLLLDEFINYLDIEIIDFLVEVLNEWDGGMVFVSYDFRFINQVVKEIWVCEKKFIMKWNGDIMDFKWYLKKSVGL